MVYMFLAEGFEETEAIATLDIVRRAKIDIKTVSVSNRIEVTGAHGVTVTADMAVAECSTDGLEMVILPGGMPGTDNLRSNRYVADLVKYAHQNELFICAICAAPIILGGMGMLKGKKATCFPSYEDELFGAIISNDSVVSDGNIVTARGMGVSIQFGLKLVELLRGSDIARSIENKIQLP